MESPIFNLDPLYHGSIAERAATPRMIRMMASRVKSMLFEGAIEGNAFAKYRGARLA
jgi:hypothetical protein